MKKITLKLAFVAFIATLTSCSSSEVVVNSEKYVEFQRVGETELLSLADDVSEIYENYMQTSSRSGDILDETLELAQVEQAIAQKCETLTVEGLQISTQLVKIQQEEPELELLTQEEFETIVNMTDDQLALCALQLSVLCDCEKLTVDDLQREITSNLYLDCALTAVGLTDIEGLIKFGIGLFSDGYVGWIIEGTTDLISATIAKDILLALAKRYAGWIGVGIVLYDFGKCVNAGKQS